MNILYFVISFVVSFLFVDVIIERGYMDSATIFYIVFCFLQLLDVVYTKAILDKGGVELNPIMRWSMEKLGETAGLVAPKLIVISLFGYLILMELIHPYVILALLAFYGWVVYNNYTVLKRMEDDS